MAVATVQKDEVFVVEGKREPMTPSSMGHDIAGAIMQRLVAGPTLDDAFGASIERTIAFGATALLANERARCADVVLRHKWKGGTMAKFLAEIAEEIRRA